MELLDSLKRRTKNQRLLLNRTLSLSCETEPYFLFCFSTTVFDKIYTIWICILSSFLLPANKLLIYVFDRLGHILIVGLRHVFVVDFFQLPAYLHHSNHLCSFTIWILNLLSYFAFVPVRHFIYIDISIYVGESAIASL